MICYKEEHTCLLAHKDGGPFASSERDTREAVGRGECSRGGKAPRGRTNDKHGVEAVGSGWALETWQRTQMSTGGF